MKPTVGVFGLTGCAGCQLQIVNLEEKLAAVAAKIDIAQFQMASSIRLPDYDIAIVEGAVSREEEIARLETIREKAKVVVALGNCATHGGVTNLLNYVDPEEFGPAYRERARSPERIKIAPITDFVDVDYFVYGCPMNVEEFLALVKALLLGTTFENYNFCVCAECKAKDNRCLYDAGAFCLGPVSRAGCGAKCPSSNYSCLGCRGLVDEPNIASQEKVLLDNKLTKDEISEVFKLFGIEESPVENL